MRTEKRCSDAVAPKAAKGRIALGLDEINATLSRDNERQTFATGVWD
jgi:hypothetical protein